ncbi:MAG: hypothetical protein H0U69_08105, partial [Trueperaceae bacterium]|nr:hypothetical protein [Trueperaceae bacterium]
MTTPWTPNPMRAIGALIDGAVLGRRRRRALRLAHRAFEAHHPRWAATRFDDALTARPDGAAALHARDPEALARAWTSRFGYADERRRERDVAEGREVAKDFFETLAEV